MTDARLDKAARKAGQRIGACICRDDAGIRVQIGGQTKIIRAAMERLIREAAKHLDDRGNVYEGEPGAWLLEWAGLEEGE